MQFASFALVALTVLPQQSAGAQARAVANPVQKVIQLLTELQGKIIDQGEKAHKTYNEFVDWCGKTSLQKQFEIKNAASRKEYLEAEISMASSIMEEATSRISELSGSIATDEADLKAATHLRELERSDFDAVDKELTDTIETIDKAVAILEKEVARHGAGAAFLQKPTQGMLEFAGAINSLLGAATLLSVDDRTTLQSMIPNAAQTADSDGDDSSASNMLQQVASFGRQPVQRVYAAQSGGIVETLQSMQSKAEEAQLQGRKKETTAKHNFEMLKLSIEAKLSTGKKEMDATKKQLAMQNEHKATCEGELSTIKKDLAADQEYLNKVQQDCMEKAVSYQNDMTSRKEELSALANAKKIIQSTTGGATSQAYSFVQVGSANTGGAALALTVQQRAGVGAWKRLAQLAKDTRSVALAQLANRLANELRATEGGGTHADPFVKVKKLIRSMINKLTEEAAQEASHKAFCDREMSVTEQQKDAKQKRVDDLTTAIEEAAAQSAELKEEIAELALGIADLEKGQAEATKIRAEENANFQQASAQLKEGLRGVQLALQVLRNYYGGAAGLIQTHMTDQTNIEASMGEAEVEVAVSQAQLQKSGAGASIIGLLEVVESDFSKNLSEVETSEAQAVDEYEALTNDNKLTKAMKESDVKQKTQQSTALDKKASELTNDRAQIQEELDAVLEYYEKLKGQCIAKPDTYEDRKARRERQIQGLQEALTMLESDSA